MYVKLDLVYGPNFEAYCYVNHAFIIQRCVSMYLHTYVYSYINFNNDDRASSPALLLFSVSHRRQYEIVPRHLLIFQIENVRNSLGVYSNWAPLASHESSARILSRCARTTRNKLWTAFLGRLLGLTASGLSSSNLSSRLTFFVSFSPRLVFILPRNVSFCELPKRSRTIAWMFVFSSFVRLAEIYVTTIFISRLSQHPYAFFAVSLLSKPAYGVFNYHLNVHSCRVVKKCQKIIQTFVCHFTFRLRVIYQH